MKIALDATYSVGEQLTGVGVYSRELIANLALSQPSTRFLCAYRPHRFLRAFQNPLPPNAERRLLLAHLPLRCDLFHCLNQRLDSARYRRTVATFHDLFVLTGNYSTPEFRARFATQARLAAERADLLIAVSAFTAAQLTNVLNVPASRIRVVHHGLRTPAPSLPPVPREPLILFAGALQKRKNLVRLIQAFEQTAPGWKLVLAGSRGFEANEIVQAAETSTRSADISLPGFITDAELEKLYARASLFAFPSLDEGFGMPVLEAMSRGVPVLTSNVSALPEVSGEAAVLVDPFDTNAIAAALDGITSHETLRAALSQRGLNWSSNFNWEKTARKTWQVYQELLPAD